ncbi:MAG: hypothetical protein IJ769_11240 [Clostridia bacterium]|nr:hypothetical protein [Clostridia bacterium]
MSINIINSTMELSDCRDQWTFDEKRNCWCLEDVLYTERANVPKFQRLSVFVPKALMSPDGTPTAASRAVPVVFENNSAGYMQMPHTWLDGPRCYAEPYLKHGLVYVTCGCRGRDSVDAAGRFVGKSPVSLVDLKTAIRFLRHNREALPGDWEKVVSVGWSAGGAMSALLGVTGDNLRYDKHLEENGAFMDESDAVFAAQIYCPIVDLEHADLAYEWCFGADRECEDSPAGPAETMTLFKAALSKKLAADYVDYVNGLGLKHPATGEALTLDKGGRGGTFYDYLMDCLNASATKHLKRLGQGLTVEDYLTGNYTYEAPVPMPSAAHHAGGDVALPDKPLSLGELVSRPPKGQEAPMKKPLMETRRGKDKRAWLKWDGEKATITGLDAYVLNHRRRMKPCTSFDKLDMDSGENQEFGSGTVDYVHFNPAIGAAIRAIAGQFPDEAKRYEGAFDVSGDAALAERVFLVNPMNFIGVGESRQAKFFRVRLGASDADTSFSIAMTLALKLQNAGLPVDFAYVWDAPHSEADYPGEVLDWIDAITKEAGK